jgi:flagellar biosynthesis protein FlhF
VREAYARVRAELGADALILEQRTLDGRVEVVASRDDGSSAVSATRERFIAELRARGFGNGIIARLPSALRTRRELVRALGRVVPCTPPAQPLCGRYRLVGPPGAGKTTALIKLMAGRVLRYGRLGTLLVGTDRSRLAGCEQLAACAELLGVEYVECAPQALPEVLDQWRHMQLVLVDAAGTRGDLVPPALAGLDDLLTVPAMWQGSALERVRARFDAHPLRGVVLTQVDQAESLGECANLLADWGLPLWWIGHGSDPAADLEPADEEMLGRCLLDGFDRSPMAAMFA